MQGNVPGADSPGREGTASPSSAEREWRQQTLLCPRGPAPAQSQVSAARPLPAAGAPLACTLALHVVARVWARMCGKSLPATRGCLSSTASLLLACSSLWFWSVIHALLVNADGLSVPGDVLWGAPSTREGAWALSWIWHQSTGPRAALATTSP